MSDNEKEMKKLLTLKDLENELIYCPDVMDSDGEEDTNWNYIEIKVLRESAREWVDFWEKQSPDELTTIGEIPKWIKHFFNLED